MSHLMKVAQSSKSHTTSHGISRDSMLGYFYFGVFLERIWG